MGYDRLRKQIDAAQSETLLDRLSHVATVLESVPEVDLSADPDDNAIIATAIAGEADLIVSGDKRHLIRLQEAAGIPIITPRKALKRLGHVNGAT